MTDKDCVNMMQWFRKPRPIQEYLVECRFTFAANGFQLQFTQTKEADLSNLRMYFDIGGVYVLSRFRRYDGIGLFYKTIRPAMGVPISQPHGFNMHHPLHPESSTALVVLVDKRDKIVAAGDLPVQYINEELSHKISAKSRVDWYRTGRDYLEVCAK